MIETQNNEIVESTLDESVYDTIVGGFPLSVTRLDEGCQSHSRKNEDRLLRQCRQPRHPKASG